MISSGKIEKNNDFIGAIMDRKERILAYISSSAYVPLKYNEMAMVLDVPESDMDELSYILDSLVKEGKIYKTKKGRYCIVNSSSECLIGTLHCNKASFGFVCSEVDGIDEVFVPLENQGNAYDGDKVLVRIDKHNNSHGHKEGHIESVIERGNETIIGVITKMRKKTYRVSADRKEFFAQVRINPADLNGAVIGDRVVVRITHYNEKSKPVGVVETILGKADSVISCLNGIAVNYKISSAFPIEVINEADNIEMRVNPSELENREDLRDKLIFTIDGDDSKDFDDAVSLENMPNGNYMLGVHIADVTHYVKSGSALDKEALNRGTSVYMPHKVIPMLPKKLSNGICSLNPEVDRLTLSVLMEMDKDGNIHSHRIAETVIHSAARMTYNNVNKILAGDTRLREKYDFLVPTLESMDKLSDVLAKKRSDRGAIDFDFPEAKVICDEEAVPVDVRIEERGKSQRLIESFMLAANETIAEAAYWAELPFVYRVHESPSNEKLTAFNDFIKNFGYSLKGKIDSESIHPKDLQKIITEAKGTPEETMISKVMLQSLMKADYRDTNDGHFGLAARYYCHFTSPIRRYPDLMIHRILKEFINGRLNDSRINRYIPIVKEAAEISSDREVSAEKAERESVDLLKTAYMKAYEGESFNAVVSSVTSFGMFAMLANSCEGLIRCESMMSDYFSYDENAHMLIGSHTNKTYKIGDLIRVTVASCNVLLRQIDFVLEEDNRPDVIERIHRRTRKTLSLSEDKKKKTSSHSRKPKNITKKITKHNKKKRR